MLVDELEKNKFSVEINAFIIEIINSHSFRDTGQLSTEAKILFDADKIEYLNPSRLEMISMFESESVQVKYCHALNARITNVASRLHFTFSQKLFHNNLKNFIALLQSPIASPVFVENIDIDMLKKLQKQSPE